MGALLVYLMGAQLASGLVMLTQGRGVADFNGGLTVGLPLIFGLLISFSPESAFTAFPTLVRPLVGNGFIMGTLMAILLEHLILRPDHRRP